MIWQPTNALDLWPARSHLALIGDAIGILDGCVQTKEQRGELNAKISRMLQSVTIALRKAMGEAAFGSVSEMVDAYLSTGIQDKRGGPPGPLGWVDAVPALVAEERARRHLEAKKGGVRAAA